MKDQNKIISYPYKKEEALKAIEDCFAFIESHCLIEDIQENKTTVVMPLFHLFRNNKPSAWAKAVSAFIYENSEEGFFKYYTPILLKNCLNKLKLEVEAHEQ